MDYSNAHKYSLHTHQHITCFETDTSLPDIKLWKHQHVLKKQELDSYLYVT